MGIDDTVMVFSGAPLLWSAFPDPVLDQVGFLRQGFGWVVWHQADLQTKLMFWGGLLLWPILVPAAVAYFTFKKGPAIRRRTGKSLLRQAGEQLRLATHAVMPPWYYIYDLYEDDKGRRSREYLNRFEVKSCLYKYLRMHYARVLGMPPGGSKLKVSSKALFAETCQASGVPVAPVLLVADKGEIRPISGSEIALPPSDLFVKPTRGCGGKGATRWEWQGEGLYRSNDGRLLTGEEFLGWLREISRAEGSRIVQPRLVNHDSLRDLTPGALCTVRALSCRDEQGGFELTHAVFRMPSVASAAVDNFHAGGVAAPIELRTGALGRATNFGLTTDAVWHERHPTSGGPILGRTLPFWDEIRALVPRAHALFPDLVAIGWDIAILEDGPCLVEANKGPDVDLIQRPHAAPLGSSRFGALLAFHLDRALRADYPNAPGLPQWGRAFGESSA